MKEQVLYPLVWLSRIFHCRGFGVQSPTDYWLVRYVINEHWPYYQYDQLGQEDDWKTRKLGRLYFRLANWRQPSVVVDAQGSPYWQAGCRKTAVVAQTGGVVELMRVVIGAAADWRSQLEDALGKTDERSVIVIEDIRRDKRLWRQLQQDERVGVTFDLYYCGLLFFDRKRIKQNYLINY